MIYTFYNIEHPITNEVIYVGKTTDYEARKQYYLYGNRHNPRLGDILKEIKELGLLPVFNAIETSDCTNDVSHEIENGWIAYYSSKHPLCNKIKGQHKGAKSTELRQIQLSDDIVLALIKQGLDKGFKNFKSYAEYILIEQSKLDLLRQLTNTKPPHKS